MNIKFYNYFLFFFSLFSGAQEFEFINLFDASKDDKIACYRIPSLVTANNGALIAAIDERNNNCKDLKWNDDINIVIRKSYDNGKTWGKIEKIIDYPIGESASDPSIIVDKITKEIFLFFNYMNLKIAKDIYRFMVISSKDDGESWSKPKDITNQIIKKDWEKDFMFITSGRGIQTEDGSLLHCLVNLNKGAHVFGSKDHGKNWFLVNYALKPGDESKIIELSDGNWLVNSRVNSNNSRYSHLSKDKGLTWETFKNIDLKDPGCNASILNYDNKILLFSNAYNSKKRENMTISRSFDNGLNWNTLITINRGSSGYSTMTKIQNGDVGLLFEKDDYSKNIFVIISKDLFLKNKS